MEEILASIRRIIEDGDTIRRPGDAPAIAEREDEAPVLTAANSDVVTFRHADRAVDARTKEEDAAAHAPALEWVVTDDDAPQETGFDLPDDFEVDFDELQAGLDSLQPVREPESAPEIEEPAAVPEPAPLVSETAGRQIAASFEELSGVFAESRRKSFDDAAREMLRPMLRDWLDDNLPSLVEKLVREEIERIARGGR